MVDRTDTEKWIELARLRRRVQSLEDELGLEPSTAEQATGNHDVDSMLYALVAEHATDALSVHGPAGEIEYTTPSITGLFGYSTRELLKRNAYDLMHPDDIERVAASHALLAEGPQTCEYRLRTADGRWRWVETRARAMLRRGTLDRLICITRDVHERKLTELALERSNADLQHFALVAAHDLHEPLRTVSGFAELLARRYAEVLDSRGRSYLDFIVDNVERMQRLIDDLLAYTRLESDHPPHREVDLDEIVSDVLAELEEALAAADARVEVGEMPILVGDRGQLFLLFRALIDNALKFRREGVAPQITIDADRVGERWLIRVRDNGRGFENSDADRIFDMFERLVGPDMPGSGIGLAAARRIVQRHEGRIRAQSRPHLGSTFFVNLPAVPRETRDTAPIQPRNPAPGAIYPPLGADEDSG